MKQRTVQASVTDRLSSTLFLAVLAHGVLILGVTFSAGPLGERDELTSFNVTLIVNPSETQEAPEEADFIADSSREGSGAAAAGDRPTMAIASEDPLNLDGDTRGADAADAAPREPAPMLEQVATFAPSDETVHALPQATEQAAAEPMRAAALLDNPQPLTLATEIDQRAELPEARERELVVSPSTRESNLAPYLDAWRRRVERVGTANFPERLRGRELERPVLEVAIGADGRLAEVVVLRSSGDSVVDQAALRILRLAMPFEPLPDAIRVDYDVLRFAYEWQFSDAPETFTPPAARARED